MVAAVLSGLQRCFLGLLSAQGLSLPGVFLGSSRLGSFLRHSLLCLFLSRRSLWLCFNRSRGRTGLLSPSILWLSVGSALGLLFFPLLRSAVFSSAGLGFLPRLLGSGGTLSAACSTVAFRDCGAVSAWAKNTDVCRERFVQQLQCQFSLAAQFF